MARRHLDGDGYVLISEGRAAKGTLRKLEHVAIAERILGRELPPGAVVHHWDENKANNAPSNLLICPSRKYHNLIHARMRAFDECGHADWRRCRICGKYSPVGPELKLYGKVQHPIHLSCNNEKTKARVRRMRVST